MILQLLTVFVLGGHVVQAVNAVQSIETETYDLPKVNISRIWFTMQSVVSDFDSDSQHPRPFPMPEDSSLAFCFAFSRQVDMLGELKSVVWIGLPGFMFTGRGLPL